MRGRNSVFNCLSMRPVNDITLSDTHHQHYHTDFLLIIISTMRADPLVMRKLEPDGRCLGKWLTSDGKIVMLLPEMVTSLHWCGSKTPVNLIFTYTDVTLYFLLFYSLVPCDTLFESQMPLNWRSVQTQVVFRFQLKVNLNLLLYVIKWIKQTVFCWGSVGESLSPAGAHLETSCTPVRRPVNEFPSSSLMFNWDEKH